MTHSPSILRKAGKAFTGPRSASASSLSSMSSSSPLQPTSGVHFAPPPNLGDVLHRFNTGEAVLQKSAAAELEGFITHMRNQRGRILVAWLEALHQNVALLKPKLEPFVMAVLQIVWDGQDSNVVAAFKKFVANLVSAHLFYAKPVMLTLLRNLTGRSSSEADVELEQTAFKNTHEAIRAVLKAAPLAAHDALVVYARECLPYLMTTDAHGHKQYIANLLHLSTYVSSGSDRKLLLHLVIDRLVQLDAHLPKHSDCDDDAEEDEEDSVFRMDEQYEKFRAGGQSVAMNNLDQAMGVLFSFIRERVQQGDVYGLYGDLLDAFEVNILPTYATGHVQFAIFYLLSLQPSLTDNFLSWLWQKFLDPNTPAVLRQSTVAYMASLTARATFVDVDVTRAVLDRLVQWIHSYIGARDEGGIGKARRGDYAFVDLKAHGPFYAACQAAFYLFAFRHQELVSEANGISQDAAMAFLRNLGFATIITSSLNPLRVCLPPVVSNFAAVSRHYQLVYCDTVIERNRRINLPVVGSLSSSHGGAKPLLLDSFFPFDPYILKRSRPFVEKIYRSYTGALASEDNDDDEEEESEGDSDMEEEDNDILADLSFKDNTPKLQSFMYGTSPGFKC